MKPFTTLLLTCILIVLNVPLCKAQHTELKPHEAAMQLWVEGKPFLMIGGELGNSSATCPEDIERIFPKLKRIGLNTVLVPAYWELTEPEENKWDFALTDKVLAEARKNGLKVVFLWFGAWKNSMSCYAPSWVKQDYKRFPRARTQAGKPLEIVSAFSSNLLEADRKAFGQWMKHLKETDQDQGTVIMVQVENEIGMLEDARDYSNEANRAFRQDVPQQLVEFLQQHQKALHPSLLQKWEAQGCPQQGDWQEMFGKDLYTDEIFMAWHYASYVEQMAQTVRSIYNLPLYVNAAMNSRGRKPGEYPSAGPLAHLMDIWHCAAPSIDLLAPDLYDSGFKDWVKQYHCPTNPLFIPEIKLEDNDGVRAFYAFGEHDALGFSPFSIEDYTDSAQAPLAQSYHTLQQLTPLITRYQGSGKMRGLLFDRQDKEKVLNFEKLTLTCRHYFTLPWDARAKQDNWPEGGGIVIQTNEKEFIVAGRGIVIEFATDSEARQQQAARTALGEDGFAAAGSGKESSDKTPNFRGTRCGLESVEQVKVGPDGTLTPIRRLNGDQTHQGRHVRIEVDSFKILRVRLYEYK